METDFKFLLGLLNKAELICLETNNYRQNVIRLLKKDHNRVIIESGFKTQYSGIFWNRDYSILFLTKIEAMRVNKLLGSSREISVEQP